ncbi:hypothetical protein BpHYR1_016127 [Brachionus plicatilis]|uniref:Uncharacterized protein n=1 Tax=Brachionus plicatilis TaxID=10195 RepID=A0A3M7QQD1_BRAPC|nr:hypothetical protein BpHYR1_016127 [Brachionus plicatilis]
MVKILAYILGHEALTRDCLRIIADFIENFFLFKYLIVVKFQKFQRQDFIREIVNLDASYTFLLLLSNVNYIYTNNLISFFNLFEKLLNPIFSEKIIKRN